jgi:hypothetical protein
MKYNQNLKKSKVTGATYKKSWVDFFACILTVFYKKGLLAKVWYFSRKYFA